MWSRPAQALRPRDPAFMENGGHTAGSLRASGDTAEILEWLRLAAKHGGVEQNPLPQLAVKGIELHLS